MADLPSGLSPESLEFIFDHVKDAPRHQADTVDAMDAKVFGILSAAGVVIGLAGLGARTEDSVSAAVFLVLATVAFMAAAIGASLALWTREYRLSYQADALWQDHWEETPDLIKYTLMSDIAAAYEQNRRLLERKAAWVRVTLAAFSAEVSFVGITLAVGQFT